MSSANTITTANKAFSDAAAKIDRLLGQACQLAARDPQHLVIAMEMGKVLTYAMMSHGGSITVLLPLILLAAAELQQHMNPSRTGLTGTPTWANIRGDDIRIQTHPLFPSTRNYQRTPSPLPPSQGPSQPRKRPVVEEPKQCRQGTEHRKRLRASSAQSRSHPALSKRQRQKSKAVVSTDDELDEDELVTPVIPTATKKRPAYVEIDTDQDMEEEVDEEDPVEPPRKIAVADVALPITADHELMDDEFADLTAEVWTPRCGQCVARDLICHQAYHKDHGGKLRVCGLCSRLKIRCGGKGSDTPKMKGKSIVAQRAHSQSRRRRLLAAATAAHALMDVPAASEVQEEQPGLPHSEVRPEPGLTSIPNQEIQNLQDEVASLRATIEALQQQVINGDWQLQETLAAQDDHAKLLADKLEPGAEPSLAPTDDTSIPLGPQAASPPTEADVELAAGPATPQAEAACLPVVMKADETVMLIPLFTVTIGPITYMGLSYGPLRALPYIAWAHLALQQIHRARPAILYFLSRPASLSSNLQAGPFTAQIIIWAHPTACTPTAGPFLYRNDPAEHAKCIRQHVICVIPISRRMPANDLVGRRNLQFLSAGIFDVRRL
ncbi:uncharacterized protein F5147DRAFT_659140 [Suillus discolor]|uniref:Uncharacterized protein n=1 Tax=Suillus discolor TaxID=1912936 RepID=A0A9P7ERK6_9AGAM|nr:uncharacterized protein F5147DRAFT_659140 [Suillus discolor]KAG2086764.1 hypothetical protein F5147DRAFT_659140 [Suillus discolor]